MNIKISTIERWTGDGGAMWMTHDAWRVVLDALATTPRSDPQSERIHALIEGALTQHD